MQKKKRFLAFIELKDRKIKRETELFLKPINVSIDDMDRFQKKKWRR